jgi:hypothetical protein
VLRYKTRRLLSGAISAVFAAGLMVVPSPGTAAASGDITPDSQTLVYITSGFWEEAVLCANPDDANLWVGELKDQNPYCQWERIGDDNRFSLFSPAKGMVLTGALTGNTLALTEFSYPSVMAQFFSWGPWQDSGGRALQWSIDPTRIVDAGVGDAPTDAPVVLGAWQKMAQQTWNVREVGPPATRQKAHSAGAVFLRSNQYTDQIMCAATDGTVRLSTNTQDPSCEWLPFGLTAMPFVLYNPEFGKVVTYAGGTGGPLVMGDLAYPNDKLDLWAFSPGEYFGANALQWLADTTQSVNAGATAPTTGPVSLGSWKPPSQSMTWKATTASLQTATVTLGDSFMSGEAGRWMGNSNWFPTSRNGTDRAYTSWLRYDPRIVYGSSYDNYCNRSDSAESHSSGTNQIQINLACSGAETVNIFRRSNGGRDFKGEAPQADQLTAVARQYSVRLIALSIGGNDLGFADIIKACVLTYIPGGKPCNPEQQRILDSKKAATQQNMAKAVTEIKAAMADAGYKPGSYRIVVQSAPSPIPLARDMRYPESTWERTKTGGCPFWDADANWARGSLVVQISTMLRNAATSAGADFLDLQDALNGREVCSTRSQLVTSTNPPSETSSEWARFGAAITQGQLQESFHPNYYGQRALGKCLALFNEARLRQASCTNTPGMGPEGMVLR